MNLTSLQNTPTMSSREIAELCDKEHRNVLADIRTMCEQLNLDVLTFQHIYLDSMNREQTLTADDQYDEKLSDLAVKPPTSGGGYKAIINYCNLIFLMIKYKVWNILTAGLAGLAFGENVSLV